MEGKDNIKELFSQKLGNYEAKVNPELWAKISTQVAAGASTTAATGLSLFTKLAIGIGVSAAAITAVVVLSTSGEEGTTEKPIIEVQKNTPQLNTPETNTVEANTVAEVQAPETIQTNKVERDTELSATTAVIPSPSTTLTKKGTERTPEPEIAQMSMRNAQSVGERTSEPQIVEAVIHDGMTSYGRPPVNQSDIQPEVTTPKTEPIKRFVNAFTPNGDGTNDYFELPSEGLTNFSVTVLNPQGEIVFQSEETEFRWDGRDMRTGELVESGNYMYMVSAYDSEGNPYPIYERLTIISQ